MEPEVSSCVQKKSALESALKQLNLATISLFT
jgi:hypothetical protein